jgi:exodeoxyribonuclease-5
MGIEFNDQQIYALYAMENWWYNQKNQLFEISGRPGTGKTTLVKYFIERIGLDYSEVAFVAYMGKAAMVLARTGLPAQTLHSLIYTYEERVDKDENGKIQIDEKGKVKTKFEFILKESLPKKIKLIVLDEASMVNKQMGKDLMSFGRVMVDDGYTKLGVGRFLVSNMINESKNLGKKGMKITADDCNTKAVNLYQSFGFKKEGEKQFPYAYLTVYELIF